jgi:hypothetical protein
MQRDEQRGAPAMPEHPEHLIEATDPGLFELLETQGGLALHRARCQTAGPSLTEGSRGPHAE